MMVLPLMIMGGLMVVGGLFALMLPETLHQHLPQTLNEGETFGKDFGWRQWLTCCPMITKQGTVAQGQQLPQKYLYSILTTSDRIGTLLFHRYLIIRVLQTKISSIITIQSINQSINSIDND